MGNLCALLRSQKEAITSRSELNLSERDIKVPQRITWAFWIIKSCCTTVGESLSDTFSEQIGLGLGVTAAIFFPILFIMLSIQVLIDTYNPYLYWTVVILMSICGTIVTDGFHDDLGVALWIEVVVFFILMILSFYLWYKSQGTLDIHSIMTFKREGFYWNAVIFTFALGTAVGDLISESFDIGYGFTLLIFVVTILLFGLAWYFFKLNNVLSFWVTYVLTRPLGAAAGDLLASPISEGGCGLGVAGTSILFLVIILVLVTYLWYYKVDKIPLSESSTTVDDTNNKSNNNDSGKDSGKDQSTQADRQQIDAKDKETL